jgi:hypothetical protein
VESYDRRAVETTPRSGQASAPHPGGTVRFDGRKKWRRLVFGAVIFAIGTSLGCGVQAGNLGGSNVECESLGRFADIKNGMDNIDRRIRRLRPVTDDLEGLRALVPDYRQAESQYAVLGDAAERKQREAESTSEIGKDLDEAWGTLVRSLQLRREGIAFFADTFARPDRIEGDSFDKTTQDFERITSGLNDELKRDIQAMFEARGFERDADGNYEIAC